MHDRLKAGADTLIASAETLDYAYQPIICTSTLRVHGFEALPRLPLAGDGGVTTLLDNAFAAGVLRQVSYSLLAKAIGKFAGFEGAGVTKLFCGLDYRTCDDRVSSRVTIDALLGRCSLPLHSLCLAISERAPIQSAPQFLSLIALLRSNNIAIALNDFGGWSGGLHLLLSVEPNYVKIDRNFIDGLAVNPRKQAIVAKLCGLARALSCTTIAQGVDCESDFRAARDLGCDLAQGNQIAQPTRLVNDLAMSYGRMIAADASVCLQEHLASRLTPIKPLFIDDTISTASDAFKVSPALRMIPVIDRAEQVQGAIYEDDIRAYLFTTYGAALLANRGIRSTFAGLVRPCPIADARSNIDVIIDRYVEAENGHGLILALENRYVGYLSNNAMLLLAAAHQVSRAREQNPLSGLPGNKAIAAHILTVLDRAGSHTLAHFDFNNFKVFNDNYGFDAGDRALLMFSGLLRRRQANHGAFVGHVGGDDFFISIEASEGAAETMIVALCAAFAAEASYLYSPADRARGGITAADRFGAPHFFPLLSVSASILHLPAQRDHLQIEMVHGQLTAGKAVAKSASSGVAINRLPERCGPIADDWEAGSFAFIGASSETPTGPSRQHDVRRAERRSSGSLAA